MPEPLARPGSYVHRRFRTVRDLRHDSILARLEDDFSAVPIAVSFRELVGPLPVDESSHSIYPYPARLIRHIPRFFLESSAIPRDATVIDPFCGSGTVLLEAQLSGRSAHGIDSNPMAALISRVKTRPLSPAELQELSTIAHRQIERARRTRVRYEPSEYAAKWYSQSAFSMLRRLAAVVHADRAQLSAGLGDVVLLALARTTRETSIRDSRIPVPVRDLTSRNLRASSRDVARQYVQEVERLGTSIARLPADMPVPTVFLNDSRARCAWPTADEVPASVIVTSPPYGAAQKYVRSTSLEAAWLGMSGQRGTRTLERLSIGREHLDLHEKAISAEVIVDAETRAALLDIAKLDSARAAIYANYFEDMHQALSTGLETSKPSTVIMICGSNRVAGREIETHRLLANIVTAQGYRLRLVLRDEIRGRTLLTARRGGAQPGTAEYVYHFERQLADTSGRRAIS